MICPYHAEAFVDVLVNSSARVLVRIILEVPYGAESVKQHKDLYFKHWVVEKNRSDQNEREKAEDEIGEVK
jgi:hypothetical protein